MTFGTGRVAKSGRKKGQKSNHWFVRK